MKESKFQKELKKEIKNRFPGSIILKNDPSCIQGIPDLLIIYENKWAMLEVKKDGSSQHQPNQDFYVKKLNDMSFASFIYPENREEVLNEMESALKCS